MFLTLGDKGDIGLVVEVREKFVFEKFMFVFEKFIFM